MFFSRSKIFTLCTALTVGLWSSTFADHSRPAEAASRWYKGNTHTHTLWSDGDGAPELVSNWYRKNGYQFLVLSDHNILSQGEKWFPVQENGRLSQARLDELRKLFGEASVVVREREGKKEMRLRTLSELRKRFESAEEFLFIQGEEITDKFEKHEVHVNGLNLEELIPPQKGENTLDTIQRNVDAVDAQAKRFGKPMIAHVNHPNFRWSLTVEDLAQIRGERFFEVYNGHNSVRNYGDKDHPSTEQLWDQALTLRLTKYNLGLLYGLATDDSHEYFSWRVGKANPGRGWVMVKAESLDADSIMRAMQRGDFYASSGVTLEHIDANSKGYSLEIKQEADVSYTTRFVGTRRQSDNQDHAIGEILMETSDNPATYEYKGDEIYVRAVVTSSRLHPNPYAAGDYEMAWLQPVVVLR